MTDETPNNVDNIDPENGTRRKSVVMFDEVLQTHTLEDDLASIDSNYEPEARTMSDLRKSRIRTTLELEEYGAEAIRKEFETYRHILPKPDILVQEQHSFHLLRMNIEENNIELPRFLRYNTEDGIKPHHTLCCLLLSEWHDIQTMKEELTREGGFVGVGQAQQPKTKNSKGLPLKLSKKHLPSFTSIQMDPLKIQIPLPNHCYNTQHLHRHYC